MELLKFNLFNTRNNDKKITNIRKNISKTIKSKKLSRYIQQKKDNKLKKQKLDTIIEEPIFIPRDRAYGVDFDNL